MLKDERQHLILREVTRNNKVKCSDLCKMLNVSEDTVRRDLKELADHGMIRKVHGGAVANSLLPADYKEKKIHQLEEKKIIAEKALRLLDNFQVILIDGSTTNLELVRHFPKELHATVFTNSFPIAQELCEHATVETFFFGGKVLKSARVTIGMDVLHFLDDVRADICFLGTRSLHAELGISTTRREEAQVKRKLAEVSQKVVALSVSEKIGTLQPFKVIDLTQLDVLVTELPADSSILLPFRNKGIEIL